MSNWYLRNATWYAGGTPFTGDLAIVDGRLTDPKMVEALPTITHWDVSDYVVSHGFVDLHTHLREPGAPTKETVATAAAAAARGGFTRLTAMANTHPTMDSPENVKAWKHRLLDLPVDISVAGAATRGRKGELPVSFAELKELGVWLFTDDGDPIPNGIMKEVMTRAAEAGVTVANHLEDSSYHSTGAFANSIPSQSEWRMLERDLDLVAKTNCRYHVQHVSCSESVKLLSDAKSSGLPVTAEVTPHHLVLDQGDISEPLGHYQMKPPLRGIKDREALVEALSEGVVDCVATDHAPHGREKEGAWFEGMPFGVTGLETAFPVLYTDLVLRGYVSLPRLIEALTDSPAAIGGWDLSWDYGQLAHVVVLDLERSQEVKAEEFCSLGTNNPFIGRTLRGWPIRTWSLGQEVWAWK